jgi:hypothetical protein
MDLNHTYLTAYIDRRNGFAKLFNAPTYDPKALSLPDCETILRCIDNDLSPENLSCDGELRGSDLATKSVMLKGARKALVSIQQWHINHG